MNDHDPLTRLVSGAVDDIDPADRLDEIRARVATVRSRRRGWYAAGGVALATAAAVTAFAVLGGDEPSGTAPDPADGTSPTPTMTKSFGQSAYFVADTGRGPRLFRDEVFLPGDRPTLATGLDALEAGPTDPDYRTLWPTDAFAGVERRGDVIQVELADAALRDLPSGLSDAEAGLAVEQVVRTLQRQAGRELPVQFRLGDNPVDRVYGVPASEPLTAGPALDVLSLMSISTPLEGEALGDTLVATGVNNGAEATMNWRIEAADGTVVRQGFATAEGWGEDRLFPWETEPIDVSDLAPGTYTFVAENPDLSDGEGFPPDTDTRSIIVE